MHEPSRRIPYRSWPGALWVVLAIGGYVGGLAFWDRQTPGNRPLAAGQTRLKTRLQREQLRMIRKAATHGRGPRTMRHEQVVRQLRAALDAIAFRAPAGSAGWARRSTRRPS